MTDNWFKPKRYGYGATPSNWRGWAATAAFGLVVLATTLLVFPWQLNGGTPRSIWQIAAGLLVIAILTGGFVRLAQAKTDGQMGLAVGKVGRLAEGSIPMTRDEPGSTEGDGA